jgi:hypothetical protein
MSGACAARSALTLLPAPAQLAQKSVFLRIGADYVPLSRTKPIMLGMGGSGDGCLPIGSLPPPILTSGD